MNADLTVLPADALADPRVQELLGLAAAMDADVPVVLLPVRVETRFLQVEEPVAQPPSLEHLADRLAAAAVPLGLVAQTNLATKRKGTVREHKEFKEKVERGMTDRVASRLEAAEAALGEADSLLRQPLVGDPERALAAGENLRGALQGAARSVLRLRSEWQRDRFSRQLVEIGAHAERTLADMRARALPGAQLRGALTVPEGDAERTATITNVALAEGARAFQTLLEGVRALQGGADVTALADVATTIPLVPPAWKAELLDAVAAAEKRVRAPKVDLERLSAAAAGIRSNDPVLDAALPDPELVIRPPVPTRVVDRLLVRIYPDDIAVDTHEEALTAEELDAGVAFWQQTAPAGTTEEARRAAWRALCAGRGSRRAAWLAYRTEPPEQPPAEGTEAGEAMLKALRTFERRIEEVSRAEPAKRLSALLRAAGTLRRAIPDDAVVPQWAIDGGRERFAAIRSGLGRLEREPERRDDLDADTRAAREELAALLREIEKAIRNLRPSSPPEPVTPDVGRLKEGAWTRAARSGVLPRRFLVVAVAGGRVAHAVAGAPVPADLKLAIDPSPDDPEAERFSLDEHGELVVGTSIRWMVDLDEALAKGMAVSVPISEHEAQHGFDRVYVLGLCDGTEVDGAQRLEELLENHHYGQTGLSVIPVGTSTNNTGQGGAGYRSVDDPDTTFAVERGALLVDAGHPQDDDAADGLRIAHALGVDPETLAHVEGADGRNAADAQLATAVLYPATVGSWLEEQLAPLVSRDARDRLRRFAVGNVAGRGLLPPLRVGAQPYGLLATTAHSRFVPDPDDALPVGALEPERDAQLRFDRLLVGLMRVAAEDWTARADVDVAYATDPDVVDPRAHFLRLLGLEAVSSTASYRFGVNVAGRHGAGSRDPDLQFGIPPKDPEAPPTSARFGPFALLERYRPVLAEAFGVDPAVPLLTDPNRLVHEDWFDTYVRLQDSRAYELRLLDHAHGLRGPSVGADPAGDLTGVATSTPASLAGQAATAGGQSLLLLLARHARLVALRDAALRIVLGEGLATEEQLLEVGSSAHYVVPSLVKPATLTTWSYLLASLYEIGRTQNVDLSSPLYTHLQDGHVTLAQSLTGGGATAIGAFAAGRYAALEQDLQAHAAAIARLGALPAARIGPLLMEHLDLASHRLDAWLTGLAQRRLQALRSTTPRGAHVGAYGWLDDLRPDPDHHPLATNVPASLDGDPSRPILFDGKNQGFLHAPSLSHGVTAAILRSGYVSQRTETDVENRMAVNLSSRRTRLAIGLMDGVRAGNTLGALLGYRLERFLHEYYASGGVTLDALIGPLRAAFPSVAGVDETLRAEVAARHVCDGLTIVDTVQRWIAARPTRDTAGRTVYDVLSDGGFFAGRPWGLGAAIPATATRAELEGLARAIDHVADALDALGDLVVAEAVHQIALGNHARAAAVVSALGEGRAPPRPQVVDIPRSGTPLTHRVVLALADGDPPAGWDAIPPTPRALAEPALDTWLSAVLGPPDDLRVVLVDAATQLPVDEVSVADMGLRALDLVSIVGPGLDTGVGELGVRALDARHPADLDDDLPPRPVQVVIRLAPTGTPDARGLAEVAPLLEALGALLGRSRAATARDFLPGAAPAGVEATGVDLAELEARIRAACDDLADVGHTLAELLAAGVDGTAPAADVAALLVDPRGFMAKQAPQPDPPRWITREAWRTALLRAASFGIPPALPPARYENRVQVRRALRAAGETALVEIIERFDRAEKALEGTPSTLSLVAAAEAVFGSGFPILPRVALHDRTELDAGLAAAPATPTEVDGWLEGLAGVRESCGGLADVLVLADAHGVDVPDATVAQLPHFDGEPWMAVELPPHAESQGRLSLVVLGSDALPAAGAAGAALLIDEWEELVPSAHETTGVAIHYDQPDATAPQCVLVAVPPRRGAWHLGDLVQTLHDTLELSRIRAVELEHLQSTLYGQLLPAISGELVPEAAGDGAPSGDRVILDFGANR